MRIDPNVVVSPITLDPQKSQPAKPAATSSVTGASVVTLSAGASAIAPEPGPEPAIAARLEKIRALLDAGEYPIDLDMLASRIVDDEILRSGEPS